MAPPKKILPIPEVNKFTCEQVKSIYGFKIKDHTGKVIYLVKSKTAATRSHYRVIRASDEVAIASVDQQQMASEYVITDELDNKLARIKIPKSDELSITISGIKYQGRVHNRGKQIEILDQENRIVVTVDKKLISFRDKYTVKHIDEFPSKIAILLPIVVDDFFHKGTVA